MRGDEGIRGGGGGEGCGMRGDEGIWGGGDEAM
jgi:hypothetical protein